MDILGRAWTAFRGLPAVIQIPVAVIAGVVALGIGTALGAVVAPADDRERPAPVVPTAPPTAPTTTTSTTSTTSTTIPATTTTASSTTTTTARAVVATTTVAPVATTRATAPATTAAGSGCSPAYPTVCIPPPPPDLDCADIPHRRFTVLPPDPHRFDGNDNDGLGCESG